MTVLITGATSGIGYAATQRLLKDGHRVIALCRDADHGLQRLGTWNGQLTLVETDLADLNAVEQTCQRLLDEAPTLQALVLNAGLQYAGHRQPRFNVQGVELTFAVNQLAHQQLAGELWPLLTRSPGGRIVITASEVHNPTSGGGRVGRPAGLGSLEGLRSGAGFQLLNGDTDFDADKAYKDSKLCNLLLGRHLAARLEQEEHPMPVITWSPGLVIPRSSDGFFRHSRENNPVGQALFAFVARDLLRLTVSVDDAGSLLYDLIQDDAFSPGFHYWSNNLRGPGRHCFESTATSAEACDLALASALVILSDQLIETVRQSHSDE